MKRLSGRVQPRGAPSVEEPSIPPPTLRHVLKLAPSSLRMATWIGSVVTTFTARCAERRARHAANAAATVRAIMERHPSLNANEVSHRAER